MATQLTAQDARQSLNAHVAAKGTEIFEKYGPRIGWKELQQIIKDETCVRYPCEIEFSSTPFQPGEFYYDGLCKLHDAVSGGGTECGGCG